LKNEKQIDNKQDITMAGANSITMASNYLSSTGSVDFLSEMSSGASSSSSG
jgi:hypothetical protein